MSAFLRHFRRLSVIPSAARDSRGNGSSHVRARSLACARDDGVTFATPSPPSPPSPPSRPPRPLALSPSPLPRNPVPALCVGQGTPSRPKPHASAAAAGLRSDTDPAAIYNGRAGRLDVHLPRLEAELTVDGALDEPVWAAGRAAHRVLPVHPGGRRRGGGLDRGAGLVLRHRHPFRHPRLRGARPGARDPGRPRQDRLRRLRPDPARHLRRRPAGVGVRGEPVRRAVRRRAGRDRVHQRQRLQQRRGARGRRPT